MQYHLKSYGLSDVGLVRENNEDTFSIDRQHNLFLLADGMGGHLAGEVASDTAIRAFLRYIKEALNQNNSSENIEELLNQVFERVNTHVYSLGREKRKWRGMGTTLCALLCIKNYAFFGHVGDSRIYLLRNGVIKQMTRDHSQLGDLMLHESLSESQAKALLCKNLLTKAIGTEPYVTASISKIELQDNDRFLLCSDGVTDILSENDVKNVLLHSKSVEDAANNFIIYANRGGGMDNATCIVVDIEKETESL